MGTILNILDVIQSFLTIITYLVDITKAELSLCTGQIDFCQAEHWEVGI